MMYDGRRYTRTPTLGFRIAQDHAFIDEGKRDVYAGGGFTTDEGQEITGMQVVIFRIADAKKQQIDDRIYYDQSTVPPEKCIPICAHSATNVALGVPKIVSRVGATINVGRRSGERTGHGQPFVEQAHYLVQDGQVYVWKSRRIPKPEDSPALQGVPQVTLEKE